MKVIKQDQINGKVDIVSGLKETIALKVKMSNSPTYVKIQHNFNQNMNKIARFF